MKKIDKKSQLEIMQTAFIIMIVFFILIIAFVFLMAKYKENAAKSSSEHLQIANLEKIKSIEYLPDIQCNFDNVVYNGCFDKIKIEILKRRITKEQLHYKSVFGNIRFSIYERMPNGETQENLIYDSPKEDYSTLEKINSPVLLYNPDSKSYSDGVMTIEIYS